MSSQSPVSALGLFGHQSNAIAASDFQVFHDWALQVLSECNVRPTFVSFGGEGFSDRFTKFGGRTHVRARSTGMAQVDSLSIVANPPERDDPDEQFAGFSLVFVPSSQLLLGSVAVDARYLPLEGPAYLQVLESFVRLQAWNFGYGFSGASYRKALFQMLEIDGGDLSVDERSELEQWYATDDTERLSRCRDVYPYNVVNEVQLNARLPDGSSLREFVRQGQNGTISPLTEKLSLWRVPEVELERVRVDLRGTGVVVYRP